ncbi:SDR family oxidoreductase [Mycobacteroides abscessus subsp. bolletii]|nr:SDR family oxidoreductase [Mycobacteroides abscessus]MDO2968219.1 SDR family oxidoreductase [Mycobacteroides abscessus subsp. bolletii]MDO3080443.1 SDR family oxidoreductase [Mycobacteroides abscessus subsp. bolletii]
MSRDDQRSSRDQVRDKVVLITGGAAGVGAEVAVQLHARGAKLVLIDVDAVELRRCAAGMSADRVLTVVADVRDPVRVQAAVDAAVDRFGGIDVMVANAGVISYGSIQAVDPEAFKRVLDINVLGVFHTVRAALASIIDRRGYVLVVSSLAAYAAAPGLAPYCASKAAVEQLANALRVEVGYRGVDVGSAHMSWIDTAMVRDTKNDVSAFAEMLRRLPYPLNTTTSVRSCGRALVSGIERRKRRVFCPRWVGAVQWLKPTLSTRVGETPLRAIVPDVLPRMDAEVAALGRSTSSHTESWTHR